MARYSVIDLGSNTIRLVAYDVSDDKRLIEKFHDTDRSKLFKDVVNEKKTAGLATYVVDGVFTEAGITTAVSILSNFLDIARNIDSDKTKIFATAVLRNCANSKEAVKEIERKIGADIDVLSAKEEAHLGYVGANCTNPTTSGTLIDIGGGSTEITALTKKGDEYNVSLGVGSVSSYAKRVKLIFPTRDEIESIASDFKAQLETLGKTKPYQSDVIYGIGGSIRAVMKLGAFVFGNGTKIQKATREQLDQIFILLEKDPSAFAHLAVRAVPDRLHSLIPGATILRTCMKAFGSQTFKQCKYGVREGYLLENMLKVQDVAK